MGYESSPAKPTFRRTPVELENAVVSTPLMIVVTTLENQTHVAGLIDFRYEETITVDERLRILGAVFDAVRRELINGMSR